VFLTFFFLVIVFYAYELGVGFGVFGPVCGISD